MKKKSILIIFILLVVIFGVYAFLQSDTVNNRNIIDNKEAVIDDTPRPMDKYERAPFEDGPVTYHVSQSADQWPKIMKATVDPENVAVGDTQAMEILAASPSGITSVTAYIRTDNGTTTVELTKVGSDEAYIPKLKLEGNEVVGVYSEEERIALRKEVENGKIIPAAMAQEAEKEVWKGDWVVQDTHTAWYTTKFVAVDNNGDELEYSVEWLDPVCSGIPINGDFSLTSNCSMDTDIVDGVAGNITINNGASLNLDLGEFVVEGSVNLTDGSIGLTQSGSLNLSDNLYIRNEDGDTYPNSALTQYTSDSSLRTRRTAVSTWTSDCDDTDGRIYQGQGYWWSTLSGTTEDINCDGTGNYGWAQDTGDHEYSPLENESGETVTCICNSNKDLLSALDHNCGQNGEYSGSGTFTGSIFIGSANYAYNDPGQDCYDAANNHTCDVVSDLTFLWYGESIKVCK